MSSEKKICGKYSVEEVADKVVEFAEVYNNILKEMPEFPMVQYIILAMGRNVDTTNKQAVINFLKIVMDGNKQIVHNYFDELKTNTQELRNFTP